MIAPGPDLPDRIAAALVEAKKRATASGKTMFAADVAAVIREGFPDLQEVPPEANAGEMAGDPAPRVKVPRARLDALFDALAAVQKGNPAQMTRHGRSQIAEARKQIMEASPDVTPEEIARRAALYRCRWPTWHLSALSLTKHWAELGPANPTQAAKTDIYQEPVLPWKEAALKVSGLSEFPEAWANWADIPANWRAQILNAL